MSKSLSELDDAIAEFKNNYELFMAVNSKFVLIDDDFRGAFQKAEAGGNVRQSAEIFRHTVWATVRTVENKQKYVQQKWIAKVGNFLTKLYPIAKLSLGLAGAIAEVSSILY